MALLFIGSVLLVIGTQKRVTELEEPKYLKASEDKALTPVEQPVGCDECERKSINNTVKPCDRHVIICGYHSIESSHIEKNNPFFEKLQDHLKASPLAFKITATDHPNSTETYTDIIVYPEQLIITLNEQSEYDVESFAHWLMDPSRPLSLPSTPLPWKKLILVCTHGARDKRCGRIGPQIIEQLMIELHNRGISECEVAVRSSSHLGGHEWAGIVVAYPSADYFGYITKKNAGALLDSVMSGKMLLDKCFRGKGSKYDW